MNAYRRGWTTVEDKGFVTRRTFIGLTECAVPWCDSIGRLRWDATENEPAKPRESHAVACGLTRYLHHLDEVKERQLLAWCEANAAVIENAVGGEAL